MKVILDKSKSDFPLIDTTPVINPNLFSTDPLTLRFTRTKYVRVGPLAVGEIEPLLTSPVEVQVAKQQVAFVQKKFPLQSSSFLSTSHANFLT